MSKCTIGKIIGILLIEKFAFYIVFIAKVLLKRVINAFTLFSFYYFIYIFYINRGRAQNTI